MSSCSCYQNDDLVAQIKAYCTHHEPAERYQALLAIEHFHLGGIKTSEWLWQQLQISQGNRVLDLGAGLGGTLRYGCKQFGCQGLGIEFQANFVQAANWLTQYYQVENVQVLRADATQLPVANNVFDVAYFMHLGMNIRDKFAMFSELFRVLKSKSRLVIFDVFNNENKALQYPLPWCNSLQQDYSEATADYIKIAQKTGFEVVQCTDFSQTMLTMLAKAVKASKSRAEQPSLSWLVGKNADMKRDNLQQLLAEQAVSVQLMVLEKN